MKQVDIDSSQKYTPPSSAIMISPSSAQHLPAPLRTLCCGYLLLFSSACALVNPLQEISILKTYGVINRLQCQRMCWYQKLCVYYSFYNKKGNAGGRDHNCVLHLNNGQENAELLEGWVEGMASADGLVCTMCVY